MGKLIKTLVLLALVGGGIYLLVQYGPGMSGDSGDTAKETSEEKEPHRDRSSDKPELQEKYGFAPAEGI